MNDEETLFTDNVKEPVNVLRWILLLVTWDGVLPVLLAATPTLIRSLWPGNMLVRDFAVVIVVIVALGVRVVVGLNTFATIIAAHGRSCVRKSPCLSWPSSLSFWTVF
jgi:hypothetical protein